LENLDLLKSIFDYVRVVDPSNKTVSISNGPEYFHTVAHGECYGFWNKNKVCDNCISLRSIKEDRSIVKFEIESGKVYLIIASPILIDGHIRAIELIKNVTENDIFSTVNNLKDVDYSELIETLNLSIVTDELTGLFNKRYIHEHLPYDIKQASFRGNSIAIAIADIDHFKKINDTYGHVIGDEVLKEIGSLLKYNIRNHDDWVARYGGEEFILVFKNIGQSHFEYLINRIRKTIEDHIFIEDDLKIQFTISMGGVYINEFEDVDYKKYISQADQLLYKAKED
jgi:diguanylate cyclase (GGDEF)-like protein